VLLVRLLFGLPAQALHLKAGFFYAKSEIQSSNGNRQSYPQAKEQARSYPQVVRSGEGCD
jgi:hypothetical protein